MTEINLIASVTCICKNPNGDTSSVEVGVAAPRAHEKFDFCCEVTLPDRVEPFIIYGVDTLQALSLGMRFISSRLEHLMSKGWRFIGVDNGEEFEIDWSLYFTASL